MLRRSFLRLFTLAESKAMFLDAKGNSLAPNSTTTLTQTLQVLAEHHHHKDTALTHAVLQQLLSLDSTDSDSETIASFNMCIDNNNNNNDNINKQLSSTSSSSSSSHLILQVMALYANDTIVRERCCRCIANMCQLSQTSHVSNTSHGDNVMESQNDSLINTNNNNNDNNNMTTKNSIADMLVEQGAIELVLGTLAMSSRLSVKGRAWTALAALNLVCLSENGAQRAAKAKGETILSDFIMATAINMNNSNNNNNMNMNSYKSDQRVAIDAALGALTRLLTAEADDNASGVQYRYEEVSYGTVEAIAQGIVWLSESFINEMQISDGNSVSRSLNSNGAVAAGHRDSVIFFPTATPSQQAIILAFLPPLHKAWMALKSISSSSKNLPIVYETLYHPGEGSGLQMALNSVLLLGVGVEGFIHIGATEELRLQSNLLLCAMEAFADLTATRKDLHDRTLTEANIHTMPTTTTTTEEKKEEDNNNDNNNNDSNNDNLDVSAVIPTEAALSVSESLAAGVVSTIAVSTIVRLHTTHKETMEHQTYKTMPSSNSNHSHDINNINNNNNNSLTHLVYESTVFDLLARSVVVLANLAGHDIAVASLNTIAALHALLQDAADTLEEINRQYCKSPSKLFTKESKPSQEEENENNNNNNNNKEKEEKQIQLLLIQQCALAGQVYAVLWGVLRTPAGTPTMRELCVYETVKRVQTAVERLCDSVDNLNEENINNNSNNNTTTTTTTTTAKESTTTTTTNSSMSAAEETMRRLIPLGRQVLRCLELTDGVDKERGKGEGEGSTQKIKVSE